MEVIEQVEIETTIYAWDCECDENFWHAKNVQNGYAADKCLRCGAEKDEQPDSIAWEVLTFIESQTDLLFNNLDEGHGDVFDTYRQAAELAKWRDLIEGENETVEA